MMPFGNPVPTAGQIRAVRRRAMRGLARLGRLTDRCPDLGRPRVRRLLRSVAVAGRVGLDRLEQVSDDAHDRVEEGLARLTGLPFSPAGAR